MFKNLFRTLKGFSQILLLLTRLFNCFVRKLDGKKHFLKITSFLNLILVTLKGL